MAALPRIMRQIKQLKENDSGDYELINYQIHQNNTASVFLQINGPINTPFEGGKFIGKIYFSQKYPNKPFKLAFVTKIYHPKIMGLEGDCEICCCIFDALNSGSWKVTTKAINIMKLAIQIIKQPFDRINQCGDSVMQQEMKLHPQSYIETAKTWTSLYAKN